MLVADEYVGAVMSDLSPGAAGSLGTESVGGGRSLVRAEVPQLEITRYAVDLRSLSHGTGTFTRRTRGTSRCPRSSPRKAATAETGQAASTRTAAVARLRSPPGRGEQVAGSRRAAAGSTLVCPTITGMKLVSPPQRGTTCWCRWAAIARAGDVALVHADVEAVRRRRGRRTAVIACRVSVSQLGGLVGGQVGVVGDVAVRARPSGGRGCTGTG